MKRQNQKKIKKKHEDFNEKNKPKLKVEKFSFYEKMKKVLTFKNLLFLIIFVIVGVLLYEKLKNEKNPRDQYEFKEKLQRDQNELKEKVQSDQDELFNYNQIEIFL